MASQEDGGSAAPDEGDGQNDGSGRTEGSFPSTVLFDFFREAASRLEGSARREDGASTTPPADEGRGATPPSLEAQRQSLLGVQVEALGEAVRSYNESVPGDEAGDVSLEDAQRVLRRIGAGDFAPVASADRDEVAGAMAAMNDAARLSFARRVLAAELLWEEEEEGAGPRTNDGDPPPTNRRALVDSSVRAEMDRAAIVEFCGLCNAAVCLPEVRGHLKSGRDLTSASLVGRSDRGQCATAGLRASTEEADGERKRSAQEMLEKLHRRFLQAVGYDPDFGSAEIRRIFFSNGSAEGGGADAELIETFAKFMSNMSVAVTKAALGDLSATSDPSKKLSDVEDGGVTRVVSVEYSEKFVFGGEGEGTLVSGSPAPSTMEEHRETEQMRQLKMAKEAAALQNEIIGELLSMKEDEREATLAKAKETHDRFTRRVLAIPPGPERVIFLQSIDSEEQRLLAMYKLSGQVLAKNGGTD